MYALLRKRKNYKIHILTILTYLIKKFYSSIHKQTN